MKDESSNRRERERERERAHFFVPVDQRWVSEIVVLLLLGSTWGRHFKGHFCLRLQLRTVVYYVVASPPFLPKLHIPTLSSDVIPASPS